MQEATGRYAHLQDVRGRGGGGAEAGGHVRTATTSSTTTTAAPTPTCQGQGQGQTSAALTVSTTTNLAKSQTGNNGLYDEKQSKQQNQQQHNHDGNSHSQQQKQQQVNSNYSICEEDSCSSGFNQLIWKAKGSFKRKKKQQYIQQPKQQQCNDTDCENSGDGGHSQLLSKRETSSKRKKKKNKQKPKQQLQLRAGEGGGGENSGKEGGFSESERSHRFLLFSMCCSKTMVQKSMQWLLYLQQSKPSGAGGDERSSSLHQGESLCGSWDSAEEEELLSGVVASPRGEEEEEGVAGRECVITVEPLPTGLRAREEAAPPPSPSRPYCAQNNREQIGERLARHWGKCPRTRSLFLPPA